MAVKLSGIETINRIRQTNLTISGSLSVGNNTAFQCELTGSSGFAVSDLALGNQYLIRIYASSSLDVTLPNSANDVIRKTSSTISMATGDWVDVVLDFNGIKRYWQVSELIASN